MTSQQGTKTFRGLLATPENIKMCRFHALHENCDGYYDEVQDQRGAPELYYDKMLTCLSVAQEVADAPQLLAPVVENLIEKATNIEKMREEFRTAIDLVELAIKKEGYVHTYDRIWSGPNTEEWTMLYKLGEY